MAAIPFSALKVVHPLIFQAGTLPDKIREHLLKKKFLSDRKVFYLSIEESLHYEALETNDFTMYNQYITATKQAEHSEQIFKELYNKFSLDHMEPINAVASPSFDFFYIVDGVHRLAILMYKQIFKDSIPLKYIHVKFSQKFIRVAKQDPTGPPTILSRFAWDTIKEALAKTVAKPKYNGWANQTEFGYHSIDLFDIHIRGQRKPQKRFEKIKQHIDFTGKTVLDLGCNTGGMLLHIPEVAIGVGLDYDEDCINAANLMKRKFNFATDFRFLQKDLNEVKIQEFCKEQALEPDCIFLLSLGSWVKEWSTLYKDCYAVAKSILLETNNDQEGVPQLELFKQLGATITLVSNASDDDYTGNTRRKTYYIQKT